MLYQNIARNVCLSSIFLPMSSSFVSRDLVVMKLIKERCKLADAQSVRDQKDEFINRWDLKGKHKPSSHEKLIRSLFPPRKLWCGIGKERRNLDTSSRVTIR